MTEEHMLIMKKNVFKLLRVNISFKSEEIELSIELSAKTNCIPFILESKENVPLFYHLFAKQIRYRDPLWLRTW